MTVRKGNYSPGLGYKVPAPAVPIPHTPQISEVGQRPTNRRYGPLYGFAENQDRMISRIDTEWPGYPIKTKYFGV